MLPHRYPGDAVLLLPTAIRRSSPLAPAPVFPCASHQLNYTGIRTSPMKIKHLLVLLLLASSRALGAQFDAAPFALPLPEGNGLLWEDPREIHKVIVEFEGAEPPSSSVRLEYWGSRWPQQHLPKDQQPGGGSVGWMELGNWYNYGWRKADAEAAAQGSTLVFTFRPVNEREFPNLKDYSAAFR